MNEPPSTSEADIRFVMVRPRRSANIGSAARALGNMGCGSLCFVEPEISPINPDALAWAVDSRPLIEEAPVFDSVKEALEDVTYVVGTTARKRHGRPPLDIRDAIPRLLEATSEGPVAILFGGEKHGLSNEDLDHCQDVLAIPTAEEHRALNLASSILLTAWEIQRCVTERVTTSRAPLITHGERDRLRTQILDALDRLGYTDLGKAYHAEGAVTRMVMRSEIPRRDAKVLFGVLRHVLWRLDPNPEES